MGGEGGVGGVGRDGGINSLSPHTPHTPHTHHLCVRNSGLSNLSLAYGLKLRKRSRKV
ncbi:MAG: hypothetical protein RMZ69_25870 [Nostoc sp. ChiQUE01a]|nr:hypothetical protein [Nostoc sp. ChiQUE01a]